MAIKISQFPRATALSSSDDLPILQGGQNKIIAASLLPSGGGGGGGSSNSQQTLTDASTISWNYTAGNIAKVTLGGNRTLAISNLTAPCFGLLVVTQDATGSRTLSLPAGSKTPSGFSLTATANRSDVLGFYYDGTNIIWSIDKDYTITGGGGGGGFDTDAQAFFTAVEGGGDTLSTGIKNAVNTLVLALKSAGIWTKCIAVYPFVGGTASAHKWNLKDPQNTDGAYRLSFTGTLTHNTSGMKGDAATAFADTHIIPATHLTADNTHFSLYLNDAAASVNGRHGCNSNSNANNILFAASISSNAYARMYGSAGDGQISVANLNVNLFALLSRRSSSDFELYFNNASQATASGSSSVGALPTSNLYLLAENTAGTAGSFSNERVAFASVGSGLTDGEAADLYTAVQAFNTSLLRNN